MRGTVMYAAGDVRIENVPDPAIRAVVGDRAVGLCGVIAAKRLGAEQIVILGRHEDRIALAREFGATDPQHEQLPGAASSFFENVTIGGAR